MWAEIYVKSWEIGWNVSTDCFWPLSVYASLPLSYMPPVNITRCQWAPCVSYEQLQLRRGGKKKKKDSARSCYFLDEASLFTCSSNTEIMIIIMMITAVMMIIIKSTRSIFSCNFHSFGVLLSCFPEYKEANSISAQTTATEKNPERNPAEAVHYVFRQCGSSMRQNLYGSP